MLELEQLASIATIVEAMFVVISVIFIWYELRKSNKLTRAANSQTLVEMSSPFNLQLIQDRQMAELWVHGSLSYEEMDDVDKYRYRSLLIWWLILQENIYYQRKKGLLDRESYEPWNNDLVDFVRQHHLEVQWETMRGMFQQDFGHHIDQIIKQAPRTNKQ